MSAASPYSNMPTIYSVTMAPIISLLRQRSADSRFEHGLIFAPTMPAGMAQGAPR